MIKPLTIFVVSALLSASIQLAGSGCSTAEENSCNCPGPVKWPPNKAERPIIQAKSEAAMGRIEELPLDLSAGTIQVAAEQVVIRYAVDGAQREVIYSILPNE